MKCFVFLPLMAALALPAYSQGGRGGRGQAGAPPAAEAPAAATTPAAPAPKVEEKTSTTSHTIQIGGQSVKYTATAGTVVLRKEDGTATASMFYVAYTTDDVSDIAHRPITFAFNGGPGSSAVWLEMGALGPKRVAMDPVGNALPPPPKLVDNEY